MVFVDDMGDAVRQFNNEPVHNGNIVDDDPVNYDNQVHKYDLVDKEDWVVDIWARDEDLVGDDQEDADWVLEYYQRCYIL